MRILTANYPSDSDDLNPAVAAENYLWISCTAVRYRLPISGVLAAGDTCRHHADELHGTRQSFLPWQIEGLLTVPDVELMNNSGRPFVLTAMTCAEVTSDSPGMNALSEALIMKKDGGAVAVLAPSGLALNALSKTLGEGFFSDVFTAGNRMGVNVLGDAVREAFRFYKSKGGADFTLDIYNLLGDRH